MAGKILKIIINAILILLVILGVFVVFSFVPFPGNYKIFTVQSGSMEPKIRTGSLIFVKPEADYAVGDIITRKTGDPKVTVTHRVYSKAEVQGKIFLETKGDANSSPDMEKFTQDDVIGKEIIAIPFLGFPVSYAKTTQGLILLIVIPAVIIIYDEAQKIRREIERKMDYRRRIKKRKQNNLENNTDEKKEE
jgi:signal peptidase I